MFPADLKYCPTYPHQWLRIEGSRATIGITDFVEDRLADIIFADLPSPKTAIKKEQPYATIESVKVTLEVLAPVSGKVLKTNKEVIDAPWRINEDPYGKGWLVVVQLSHPEELEGLMNAQEYQELTEKILKGEAEKGA